MSNSSGYAGRSGTPLPPQRGAGPTQESGAFAADLGPTIWMTQRPDLPPGLTIGLLTKPPKPEGTHHVELIGEGYARQPLRLVPGSTRRTQANDTRITFGPMLETWPKATHLAIFDEDDRLLYYGAIVWRNSLARPGPSAPGPVLFEPHSLRVKLPNDGRDAVSR